jgi:hypothetical protein
MSGQPGLWVNVKDTCGNATDAWWLVVAPMHMWVSGPALGETAFLPLAPGKYSPCLRSLGGTPMASEEVELALGQARVMNFQLP